MYISTRDTGPSSKPILFTFWEAIRLGLAPDGGLFVPQKWPHKNISADDSEPKSYSEIVQKIGQIFCLSGDVPFISMSIPIVIVDDSIANDGICMLELWHGPTWAFKDFAMQYLAAIFEKKIVPDAMQSVNNHYGRNGRLSLLTATSGDTGSAAAAAFADRNGINCFVLFPPGISEIQRLQMTRIQSPNVHTIEVVDSSFDDCQKLVKTLFMDKDLVARTNLTTVNSINFGRLVAQIGYYIFAYKEMKKKYPDHEISVAVPTGNFGNVLAAYYASQLAGGATFYKICIATNSNRTIPLLNETGHYKPKKQTIHTMSPSMDIQAASNLERYFRHISGDDTDLIKTVTKIFENPFRKRTERDGSNSETNSESSAMPEILIERFRKDFLVGSVSEEETKQEILSFYLAHNKRIIDPHTAVGTCLAKKFGSLTPKHKWLCVETAHYAKFPCPVVDDSNRETSNLIINRNDRSIIERRPRIHNSADTLKKYILDHMTPNMEV